MSRTGFLFALVALTGAAVWLAAGATAWLRLTQPSEALSPEPRATPHAITIGLNRPVDTGVARQPGGTALNEMWQFTTQKGGSALTPTAAPTPPPTAAPTPLPTAAPTLSGDRARSEPDASTRLLLDERFASAPAGWPNDPQATAWSADGVYRLFARWPGRFVAVGAPIAESLADVVVAGSFRKVGGPPGGGYGLIVRERDPGRRDGLDQGGRFYVLEAGDRGEVGIWRRDDDAWIELLPWTPSAAVRQGGATNELTVQAVGQQLTFLVNGIEVAAVVDAALPAGGVGLFAGGDGNEVAVDRFAVWVRE